jgi:hypothetical protein
MAMSFDRLGQWLDIITKVGLVLGGLFSGWQYLEAKRTEQVKRTFDYVAALNQGETAKAREAINGGLRRLIPELTLIDATPMAPDQAAAVHARIADGLIFSSDGGKGLEVELDLVLDLFDQVQICVDEGLCDAGTARAFVGAYARTLWFNFQPTIEKLRATIPGYGAGLEHFVAEMPKGAAG